MLDLEIMSEKTSPGLGAGRCPELGSAQAGSQLRLPRGRRWGVWGSLFPCGYAVWLPLSPRWWTGRQSRRLWAAPRLVPVTNSTFSGRCEPHIGLEPVMHPSNDGKWMNRLPKTASKLEVFQLHIWRQISTRIMRGHFSQGSCTLPFTMKLFHGTLTPPGLWDDPLGRVLGKHLFHEHH